MRLTLGLDGGGTKTEAVILDADGAELGRGYGGSGNVATNEDDALVHALRESVWSALHVAGLPRATVFASACAGVAGYSLARRRAAFESLFRAEVPAETHRVEPDYVIAYWGATHGEPGILVIAGTGAVSYGRNAQGETCKIDGLGYLLGDRGSGFNLGLRVLRYTLEQQEAGREDRLTRAVTEFTGARSQSEIVQWLYSGFSPARVAGLSPLVGGLAEEGEPAAQWHVAEMARRLRQGVRQVRHRLWLPRKTPVYPLGGLWQLGSFFQQEFCEPKWRGAGAFTMEPEMPSAGHFVIGTPISDAAYGAALLARE